NSLQRNVSDLNYPGFGNDPANWYADSPSAGTRNPMLPPVPRSIVTQPISRAVPAGTRVEFNVGVCGTMAVRYQWMWNGGVLPNRTNQWLVIESATAADAGTYQVAVISQYGPPIYTNLSDV